MKYGLQRMRVRAALVTCDDMFLGMQVADLIGADPKEIIFTSGATESNNLAIKGISNFYRDRKKHIITTQTERKCHKKTIQ